MRRAFGVLILFAACGLFAVAAALLYISARFQFEKAPAIIAAVLLLAAAGAFVAAARLVRWRRAVFAGTAAILALAATAVAIPNLTQAVSGGRSPQKRTMADIRSVAMAVEAFATDMNRYPIAGNLDELAAQIEPTYLKTMPRRDGWQHDLRYEGSRDRYFIASPGKDEAWQRGRLSDYPPAATTSFDADIIFSNGYFIQYPEGVQTQ